ncbi:MAG TPA: UDP-glucose 4-epimerase GalE [Pyrinomonadaceae bacterium]|nr:UDP-glucose 4-epimerase GalE [Pyrinomonadaceae bacterium]
MRILVTGGAGYIGSVVAEELIAAGHEVFVYDNLSKGHRAAVHPQATLVEADLMDGETLRRTFREQRTEAVIHMAADALVGESVTNPAKYYRNNFVAGLALLDAMRDASVRRIVFSSTCATYGEPERVPMDETLPTNPLNPYGQSKLAFEGALKWYGAAYGMNYVALRYFNAAGATRRCGEQHDPESHIIPLVLQVATGRRTHIEIYGDDYPTRDGTCVRDYIHIVDLARAHPRARYPRRTQRHLQPRLRRRRLHRQRGD